MSDVLQGRAQPSHAPCPELGPAAQMPEEVRHRLATLDALPQAVLTLAPRRRIVYANRAAEDFFGYSRHELINRPLEQLIVDIKRDQPLPGPAGRVEQPRRFYARRRAGGVQSEFSIKSFLQNGTRYLAVVVGSASQGPLSKAVRDSQMQALELIALNAPLHDSLIALLRGIELQRPGACALVALLSDDGMRLGEVFSPSMDRKTARRLVGQTIGPVAAPWGRAIYLRRPVTVTGDALLLKAVPPGARACCAVPILARTGEVLGACAVFVATADETEHAILAEGARIAGLAIERKHEEARMLYLAHHDTLTGLPNRALLEARLQQAIGQASRNNGLLAVLFVDLDHFKEINDMFGHQVGDQLLKEVATRMQTCLRAADSLARLGGDEFVIGLADIRHRHDAAAVAEKIRAQLGERFLLEGRSVKIGCSIGISVYPLDGDNAPALLGAADTAMYEAKSKGRDNYQFFSSALNVGVRARRRFSRQLHQALVRKEFVLHFQPLVSLRDGTVAGTEALLRWQHPTMGLLGPRKFIPMLEEAGLMESIGGWILREACTQRMAWEAQSLSPGRLALNLSAHQLARDGFVQMLDEILQRTGVRPEWIELEITENIMQAAAPPVIAALHTLKNMGVSIALDDFGSGHAPLALLRRFPVDRLKLDQVLFRDLIAQPEAGDLIGALLAVARRMGIATVGEGVESEAQLAHLVREGGNEMQGYLFSQPLPADQITRLLAEGRRLQLPGSPVLTATSGV